MSLQFAVDGLLLGAMIGLGAIGLTLTYSILRFSNFAHGEFLTVGAYGSLLLAGLLTRLAGGTEPIGPLSFGWPLIVAVLLAMALTGGLALLLDWLLFARLRRAGHAMVVVMASFGAAMALRSSLEFVFSARPVYFSRDLQIAMRLGGGIRITADQVVLLALTAVLVGAMHLLMTRTRTGRAMRAVSQNPTLARVAGIDVDRVVRITWLLGGALACVAGWMIGLLVQIRPSMGLDMLLPIFAAAILGGIGSVAGAVLGGLIVGVTEALAVGLIGAEWRAAVAFLILIAVLLVRPTGLFGVAER